MSDLPRFPQVKELFREGDRKEMLFAFDLWSYDDVREHHEDILERLEDGTMPCDGAWEPEQVAIFRDWIGAGFPE